MTSFLDKRRKAEAKTVQKKMLDLYYDMVAAPLKAPVRSRRIVRLPTMAKVLARVATSVLAAAVEDEDDSDYGFFIDIDNDDVDLRKQIPVDVGRPLWR